MMIQIESMTETATGRYYTLSTDKGRMSVGVAREHVTVCMENASNRVWRGPGKTFHGPDALAQATASYKSSACKAMLETVAQSERALSGAAAMVDA